MEDFFQEGWKMLIPITSGKTWGCSLQKFWFGDTKWLDNVCLFNCLLVCFNLTLVVWSASSHFGIKLYSVFKSWVGFSGLLRGVPAAWVFQAFNVPVESSELGRKQKSFLKELITLVNLSICVSKPRWIFHNFESLFINPN